MIKTLELSSSRTESINFLLMKKFTNLLMIAGKRNMAYKIFSAACSGFVLAAERNKRMKFPPSKRVDENRLLFFLQRAIKNVQPSLEGRRCRVGGTTKIVPAAVSNKRGSTLAMRWIIESARKRKETSKMNFSQCLTEELLDAYQKTGRPRQRRDEYHKICQASRGYLRYRWW